MDSIKYKIKNIKDNDLIPGFIKKLNEYTDNKKTDLHNIYTLQSNMNINIANKLSNITNKSLICNNFNNNDDLSILCNLCNQLLWLTYIKPEYSILKFDQPRYSKEDKSLKQIKLFQKEIFELAKKELNIDFIDNYNNKTLEYIDGELYLQAYNSHISTESTLFIKYPSENKNYLKSKLYNKTLSYFNQVERQFLKHDNKHSDKKLGFDHCFDCSLQTIIWESYINKYKLQNITPLDEVNKYVSFYNINLKQNIHGELFNITPKYLNKTLTSVNLIPISYINKYNKYAYVWLVMKNDSYLIGASVSAWSVKKTNTIHDLVLMVTNDIDKNKIPEGIFDEIIEVPYLNINSEKLIGKKQQQLYDSWYTQSPTKWNTLGINKWTKTKYKSTLFLDADTIIIHNIDHIFDKCQSPCGTFYNAWADEKDIKYDYMNFSIIDNTTIINSLTNSNPSYVMIGSTVLLPADEKLYNLFVDEINKFTKENLFGFKKNISMVDEKVIAWFMSMSDNGPMSSWNNIPPKYNLINWEHRFIKKDEFPFVLHYFGQIKPWNKDILKHNSDDNKERLFEYLDVYVWYEYLTNYIEKYPEELNKFTPFIKKILKTIENKEELEKPNKIDLNIYPWWDMGITNNPIINKL